MDYLKLFQTHEEYEAFVSGGTMMKPNVSHCVEENEVHYNPHTFADEYFTTVARENGTISFNIWKSMGTDMITSISYSTDNGETWTVTNNTNDKQENLAIDVNVNNGDKVMWKGNATQLGYFDENDYGDIVGSFFSSTCAFDAQGNIMSLLYGDNFKNKTTIENEYAFASLFFDYMNNEYEEPRYCKIVGTKNLSLPATTLANSCYWAMFRCCTSLTTAPELSATTLAQSCCEYMFNTCTSLTVAPELPATTLVSSCYSEMFMGCTSLVTAPELPAETLADGCYRGMFWGCSSLTTAPELHATTLANACYAHMFQDCISLITAPELPATSLTSSCYEAMFYNCTSLTTTPLVLPAETLVNYCYSSMFSDCISLTTAPQLPATTLVSACYQYMFNNCTNLNYIKAMFTTTPSISYTQNWVNGVASSGTFVKNTAATWNVTGVNGVPTGWTIETATA